MNGCSNTELICKIAKKIVKMQNEAVEQQCTTCTSSLAETTNNTKPVSFYMCDGSPFEAFSMPDDETSMTSLFRIEEVIDDCFVNLRLLKVCSVYAGAEAEEENLIKCQGIDCTDQTCILDLACVCCIQCFDPINCPECGE